MQSYIHELNMFPHQFVFDYFENVATLVVIFKLMTSRLSSVRIDCDYHHLRERKRERGRAEEL